MIEESKYCSDVMKKHFNKKLVMMEEDNEDFENLTKRWICHSDYVDNDVKVRDHGHITGKYRGSANDMYIFFEKGTRDGISYISNRYSKANNKYLKSYDPKQESKYILKIDVNNFHGHAMSKFLSTNGFKWIDPNE